MRIQPKEMFKRSGEAETRFNTVIKQYDNFINTVLKEKRTWMMVGLLSLIVFVISIIGWVYVALQVRDHIVVIEVNELGRARYVGQVSGGAYWGTYTVHDYMIESVLTDFITFTRTVYTDSHVMSDNITRAAGWSIESVRLKLRDDLLANDPFELAGRIRRDVSIESRIKITDNTWQFDWFDITRSMDGREISRVRFRGIFTVVIMEPATREQRMQNPLGIYIVDYNIVQLNEVLR